jgi:protein-S-isoprenylcysteine O-methyltransferase Ste14
MDDTIFYIWMALGVFTHGVRTTYEILKYRKVVRPTRVSFIIILVDMLLLWVSWMSMCETDVYRVPIPDGIRYIGLAVVGFGVVMFLTALMTIRALETYEGDLMTRGIYSKIRHPMYLSFILWFIGYSVFSGSLISSIVSIVFIVNVLFWRFLEEKELEVRFPAYSEYRKRTWF